MRFEPESGKEKLRLKTHIAKEHPTRGSLRFASIQLCWHRLANEEGSHRLFLKKNYMY